MRLPSLWQKKEEVGGIKYKEFQCKYNDDVIMLKLNTSTPELLSFTILSGKRKNKLKDYEYNLFHGKKWKNWLLWDEIELIQNENELKKLRNDNFFYIYIN